MVAFFILIRSLIFLTNYTARPARKAHPTSIRHGMHRTNRNTTVIVSQPQYKDGEVQRAFIMTERRPPSHACQIARSGAPAPPGAGAVIAA